MTMIIINHQTYHDDDDNHQSSKLWWWLSSSNSSNLWSNLCWWFAELWESSGENCTSLWVGSVFRWFGFLVLIKVNYYDCVWVGSVFQRNCIVINCFLLWYIYDVNYYESGQFSDYFDFWFWSVGWLRLWCWFWDWGQLWFGVDTMIMRPYGLDIVSYDDHVIIWIGYWITCWSCGHMDVGYWIPISHGLVRWRQNIQQANVSWSKTNSTLIAGAQF